MSDKTPTVEEQYKMPLADLRSLALQESDAVEEPLEAVAKPPIVKAAEAPVVDDDVVDNSVDEEPTRTIYRREIDNEDGSGVDVYEADTLEDLVNKLADGKKNANKKIRELNKKVKIEDTRTAQQIQDDEYALSERLKTNPRATMREIITETIAEEVAKTERSKNVQSDFVTTHPSYIANATNGGRITKWVQTHGYTEFTSEALEKAFHDLKASGLLELKSEEANETTSAEDKVTPRTEDTKSEVTQPHSQKKASSLSTRNRTPIANKGSQPTQDELYAMPMEQLRNLANAQLSK